MRFLDNEQKKNIGFHYIIENINTVSKLGDEKKNNIEPFTNKNRQELIDELENTQKIISSYETGIEMISCILHNFCKVKDIVPTIKKIGTGMILDEIELFEIKVFAKICTDISSLYKSWGINLSAVSFEEVQAVFDLLDPERTGYETFYIYDSFSEELKAHRIKRRDLESQIQAAADVEKKNELLLERAEILSLEESCEYEIKKDLTKQLEPFSNALKHNANTIGYLDFLLAKAKYFMDTEATLPQIISDGEKIILHEIYNPYYEEILLSKGTKMQRLELGLKSGVTVLTGANMGGKSIAMKTVALNVLLANCGMYVYAVDSQIPVVDFLYMISDDLQSIDSGLSTFGAEMIQLKTIIGASGKKNGLIILDELARGTNPQEGRIIVNSVIDLFGKRKSYTFISTHFDGVDLEGATHLQVKGISEVNFDLLKNLADKNSKEALSILQRHMDYSIHEIDKTDIPKNALQIARLLGIDMLDFGRA